MFSIAGITQLGSSPSTFSSFSTNVTQIFDMVSRVQGKHAFKAGIDLRWEHLDAVQPPNPTGNFAFSTLFTNQGGVTNSGNALASFLLGQVNTFSIDLQSSTIRPRAHIAEFFLQDDWKATPRLTVNAGLRWTLNFPSTEAHDQGAVFNLATQQYQYLGKDGFSRSARELHYGNFGPRLGFSYMATPKTVLRSSYGLIFIEQTGITTPFTTPQFPFLQTVQQATLDSIHPAFVLSNGPSVAPIPLTADAGLGQGVFTVNRKLGSGYVQQWNLAAQHELARDLTIEIAYTGSVITRVGIPDTNLNQLTVDQLAQGASLTATTANPYFGQIPVSSSIGGRTISVAQLMKPYPRFLTVSAFRNNTGRTNYNAAELKLEKRTSYGLTAMLSYTHSKLMDDASSVFDSSILTGPVANYPVADSFNPSLERDASLGDMPNVTVGSAVYAIPLGRGHQYRLFRRSVMAAGRMERQWPDHAAERDALRNHAGHQLQRLRRLWNAAPDHPWPGEPVCRKENRRPLHQHGRLLRHTAVQTGQCLSRSCARARVSRSRPRSGEKHSFQRAAHAGAARRGVQRHQHSGLRTAGGHGRSRYLRVHHGYHFRSTCCPGGRQASFLAAPAAYFVWKILRLISGQNSLKVKFAESMMQLVSHLCPTLVHVRYWSG